MKKRQFIAGAKCPKCGREDTVVQIRDETHLLFECIRCEFKQSSDEPLKPNNKIKEIKIKIKPNRH